MGDLTTVTLIYDNNDRIEYQLYAEFLRLAGVYVSETLRMQGDSVINEQQNAGEGAWVYKIKSLPVTKYNDYDICLTELKKDLQADMAETNFFACYDELKSIFLEENLLQSSVTLQYFRMKDDLVEEAGRRFENAAQKIERLIKSNNGNDRNRHLRYASIYCWQKANLAYHLCGRPIAVYVDILAGECMSLMDDFPDFSNAWVLLGFIYEFLNDKIRESLDAFDQALFVIGNERYASSVYYWMGRRCERYHTLQHKSEASFTRAYQLQPKYRNIYKMSAMYERQGDYPKTVEYLKECLKALRLRNGFMDPLEQEYYYKVSVRLGYIYIMHLQDYTNGILYEKQALAFRKEIADGIKSANAVTNYYFYMYGNTEAPKYIKLGLERMAVSQPYRYLAKAYGELKFSKEAEDYRKLSEQ